MATGGSVAGQKRKAASQPNTRNLPKRRKTEIPTQDAASGGLNITNFVKAREFEIKALEASMQKSRKGLMSRAFQQLPRHMRRRTASHNVKKIPKRLRKRADREMKDDNTPTVNKRSRMPSRKLRMRLETAKLMKKLNQRTKTVRQKKKEAKANAKEPDPDKHVDVSRVPRIKKNTLAEPPKATSKYKKRQVNKTWLPTHLWHTKRAHMTRPTEPLWRLAIPLSPNEKSYRPNHRAGGSRGCIAWDTSYLSTVGCLGTEHTLENMLRLLGFACECAASRQKKWKAGTRHARGWIHEIDNSKYPIAPATVIWMVKSPGDMSDIDKAPEQMDIEMSSENTMDVAPKKKHKIKLDRRLFIRIHPSAFQHFWVELLKAAKMQKPQVLIEDLRFEIGSVELTGPGSTEALLGVLKPRHSMSEASVEHVWTLLAGLNNPTSLPDSSLLAFNIVDPRLCHPPQQIDLPKDQAAANKLNELIVSWPVDKIQTTPRLSSHKARWTASTTLPSQKAINRRKTAAAKGQPIAVTDKDPAIPVMLLANRSPNSGANSQGSWTVLLPWCCVDAVWRSLMYYPLSSGGTPRFGGLNQTKQLAFEHMAPWYPGDFPGTEAGKAWERTEAEKRFDEWVRRPPSRRLAWNLVELGLGRRGEVGRGWTCDWEYLFKDTDEKSKEKVTVRETKGEAADNAAALKFGPSKKPKSKQQSKKSNSAPKAQLEPERRRNTSSPESDASPNPAIEAPDPPLEFSQLTPSQASLIIKSPFSATLPAIPAIATVRIHLLTKGTPKPAARIYRLPVPPLPGASSQPPPTTQQPTTNPAPGPSTTTPSTSSASAPPPAQPSPPTPLASPSAPHTSSPTTIYNLREKWLSLLPSTDPSKHKTQPLNHRSLPRSHVVHPPHPPTHIHVLPRNAPQSVIDEFGPPKLSAEQAAEQELLREREALMKELMKNEVKPGDMWDAGRGLVECPGQEDLVGYVTSGGFNLSEGRGTAIGGVWVQRVIGGWIVEDDILSDESVGGSGSGSGSAGMVGNVHDEARTAGAEGKGKGKVKPSTSSKAQEKKRKKRERERYLCVVRNAGESVGRLGVWEVCE